MSLTEKVRRYLTMTVGTIAGVVTKPITAPAIQATTRIATKKIAQLSPAEMNSMIQEATEQMKSTRDLIAVVMHNGAKYIVSTVYSNDFFNPNTKLAQENCDHKILNHTISEEVRDAESKEILHSSKQSWLTTHQLGNCIIAEDSLSPSYEAGITNITESCRTFYEFCTQTRVYENACKIYAECHKYINDYYEKDAETSTERMIFTGKTRGMVASASTTLASANHIMSISEKDTDELEESGMAMWWIPVAVAGTALVAAAGVTYYICRKKKEKKIKQENTIALSDTSSNGKNSDPDSEVLLGTSSSSDNHALSPPKPPRTHKDPADHNNLNNHEVVTPDNNNDKWPQLPLFDSEPSSLETLPLLPSSIEQQEQQARIAKLLTINLLNFDNTVTKPSWTTHTRTDLTQMPAVEFESFILQSIKVHCIKEIKEAKNKELLDITNQEEGQKIIKNLISIVQKDVGGIALNAIDEMRNSSTVDFKNLKNKVLTKLVEHFINDQDVEKLQAMYSLILFSNAADEYAQGNPSNRDKEGNINYKATDKNQTISSLNNCRKAFDTILTASLTPKSGMENCRHNNQDQQLVGTQSGINN